jgi:nucleotide-binding universal stress UspA family protein
MNKRSFLLVLDGSEESRWAAQAAWALARTSGFGVTAQYVVDTPSLWRLLSYGRAGFIGSGPFFEAYEAMVPSLRRLGETLLDVYNSQAEGMEIDSDVAIDEGSPAEEIAKRAIDHDVVILGYAPGSRYAGGAAPACENLILELARQCSRPILVLKHDIHWVERLRLLVRRQPLSENVIKDFLEFAAAMKLSPELGYAAPAAEREEIDRIRAYALQVMPGSPPITVAPSGPTAKPVSHTLTVIPYLRNESTDATTYTTELLSTIESRPAVLLWPMEPAKPEAKKPQEAGATAGKTAGTAVKNIKVRKQPYLQCLP